MKADPYHDDLPTMPRSWGPTGLTQFIIEDKSTDVTWKDPARARAFLTWMIIENMRARGTPCDDGEIARLVNEYTGENPDGWVGIERITNLMSVEGFDYHAMLTHYFLIFRS
jgi:hypothetical protein